MPYDFELTITGLCVLTFTGEDKTRPREVNVLFVGSGHPRHIPLLGFSTARDARPTAGSNARFRLVPTPDGRQLALVDLHGLVEVLNGAAETNPPTGLIAHWREAGEVGGDLPRNAEEEKWLNWVPGLPAVNPSIPPPVEDDPFAGLNEAQTVGRVRLTGGELKAANLVRRIDDTFVVWDFKAPGDATPVGSQALAAAAVLRMSGLTAPVVIRGEFGVLGLVGQRNGELVQASITNLPEEDVGNMDRLEHFAHFFDLVDLRGVSGEQLLPEARGITDTSQGAICPAATFTRVP